MVKEKLVGEKLLLIALTSSRLPRRKPHKRGVAGPFSDCANAE